MPVMPELLYTTADGIAEGRRRIAICADEPEGGALDLGGLSLDDAALAELLPAITALPPLKRLNLGVHAAETNDYWPPLKNSLHALPARLLDAHYGLEAFDFTHNNIGAKGLGPLARLPNLTHLNLRGCKIKGGTRHLAKMVNLTSLDIGRTGLREQGAKNLAGRLGESVGDRPGEC